MDSKIRIKMGPIEVEYEGTEAFLKEELPELLAAVSKLYRESGLAASSSEQNKNVLGDGTAIAGTTASIAAKLNSDSGTDLIMAAAARLSLVLKKKAFTRKEILSEMKSAKNYHKKTYVNNLTGYLKKLMQDGQISEPNTGQYALPADVEEKLRKQLA